MHMMWKNNDGSSVVEVCLIFPIVVWCVCFVMHLFISELNQGIVTGDIYETIYNREAYIYNHTEGESYQNILEDRVSDDLNNQMLFLKSMDTSSAFYESGTAFLHNMEQFSAGDLEITVSYKEICPGISNVVDAPFINKTIRGKEEIRDTANNLRRWQLYGQVLPD